MAAGLSLLGCRAVSAGGASPLRATDLRAEHRHEPLALPTTAPRLSWRVATSTPERRGETWSAHRVQVATSAAALRLGNADLWDSGWVAAPAAGAAVYGGAPLRSRARAVWRVQLREPDGRTTPWSEPAAFGIGLVAADDWHGDWIGLAGAEAPLANDARRQAPWLRRVFDCPVAPRRAVLHVASVGYHEVHLNGARVGDALLAPSVSDLSARVHSATYDVTDAVRGGRNALGLWLGPGWSRYPRYGVPAGPLLRAELDLELPDGAIVRIVTDGTWRARPSHVAAIGGWDFGGYGGERLDAGRDEPRWSAADFDDSGWGAARTFGCALAIVPENVEPNRAVLELRPVSIATVAAGVHRIDMGRAFTGVVELRLRGEPGATVTLSFAERDEQRETYGQRSELVLGPDGTGTFRHHFDYVAARWITVAGTDRVPATDDVRAFLVRSGYRSAAAFACSDPLLQRIHDLVTWTFECLSLGGYVVDCAHRERWGYGGDAHATMETALDHFDLAAFYGDWLDDWAAIQDEHGNLPYTCPTYHGGGGPAWSGIVVMLPWEVYRRTGDLRVLQRSWPVIERWLAFLETCTTAGVLQFYNDERYTADVYAFLGDWVPPGGVQAGGPPDARRAFFNNAYRVWAVRTAAAIAKAIGRDADAAGLARRADELAAAVHRRFYDAAQGVYVEARQTYYALPVLAGIGPEEVRAALFARLVDDVERRRHVDTGIHGTWFLVKLLLERHRADLLALVASQTDAPSWGDMLARGATTIWEQWDGVHSRMHSSFLSIGAFFVEGLLGIRPDAAAPGYAHFELAPAIGAGGLARASGHQDTVRGMIAAAGEVNGDTAELAVTVPPGATATVRIPTAAPSGVQESGVAAAAADGVRAARAIAADEFACEVGSGSYRFTFAAPRRR